ITSSLSLRSSFFDYLHRDHRDIHSFPTRRSSDLKRKGPPRRAFPWCVGRDRLERLDLVRLQALLALDDLEGNLLAFLQRLEAGALDGTEMHEQVRAALRGDEAEALGVVEPLDGTGLTIRHVLLLETFGVGLARPARAEPRLSSKG